MNRLYHAPGWLQKFTLLLPPWGGRLADHLGVWAYRLSGGWVGHWQFGIYVLLLTTTGRKTGRPRTHSLLYFPDGDNWIVMASNWGQKPVPAWYYNLQSQPRARVQVGRRTAQVVAQVADPAERARLWALALQVWPTYARYQQTAGREVSVVILRPA